MEYLNYISRVSDQNGISQLYIKGFQQEWYISTIYQGFSTKMVYLNYILRVSDQNGVSHYISRVSDQNGISHYISRVSDHNGISHYISRVSDHNGISQLDIEGFRQEWYISLYIIVEIYHSDQKASKSSYFSFRKQ